MFSRWKKSLRERLLGWRFRQLIHDDARTLGRFGNRYYLRHHPSLPAPGFQPPFESREFSCYSQNGEDGLILYLLSRTGVRQRYVVEIGTEDGRECNSSNLILNYGWHGCLVEADRRSSEGARDFFARAGAAERVRIVNDRAAPENINELLRGNGVPEDIDVLSIDIDSYDYWVWRALDAVQPAIVVIEYNASFGPLRSVTVPYPPAQGREHRYYHGASLAALARLGGHKGYVLVGTDSKGVNAFFIRADLAGRAEAEAVTAAAAYRPHFRRGRKRTPEEQWRAIAHLPLTEIE